jgi:hypothetical protein
MPIMRTTTGKKVTMYIPITGEYTEILLKSLRDLGFKEDDHTWFKEKSRLLKKDSSIITSLVSAI